MIEDFITELDVDTRAIRLILLFLREYMEDETSFILKESERTKNKNVYSLINALYVLNKDIVRLRNQYYNLMLKEKYSTV